MIADDIRSWNRGSYARKRGRSPRLKKNSGIHKVGVERVKQSRSKESQVSSTFLDRVARSASFFSRHSPSTLCPFAYKRQKQREREKERRRTEATVDRQDCRIEKKEKKKNDGRKRRRVASVINCF